MGCLSRYFRNYQQSIKGNCMDTVVQMIFAGLLYLRMPTLEWNIHSFIDNIIIIIIITGVKWWWNPQVCVFHGLHYLPMNFDAMSSFKCLQFKWYNNIVLHFSSSFVAFLENSLLRERFWTALNAPFILETGNDSLFCILSNSDGLIQMPTPFFSACNSAFKSLLWSLW